jgi:phospholipase C
MSTCAPIIGADRVDEITARGDARRDADNLQRINRIVVLVQENRSFDHMLGYLSLPPVVGGRGRTDVDGLSEGQSIPGPDRRPVSIRPVLDGVFRNDPGHTRGAIASQIADGAMNDFVNSFAVRRRDGVPPSSVPGP